MDARCITGLALLAVSIAIPVRGRADEAIPPGRYEITTERSMPHLDENLRYMTTRELRCVGGTPLAWAFPVLADAALAGCGLEQETRHRESVSYVLVCRGAETTGRARWHFGAERIRGQLDVKLGGKNMTFNERVTARRLGDCDDDGRVPEAQ